MFASTDFEEPVSKILPPQYLHFPVSQHSRILLFEKEWFSPKYGSGREQLPERAKEVLLPRAPNPSSSPWRQVRDHGVHVLCRLTKMIVIVDKIALGTAPYELKLGTCGISKSTGLYHLFVYNMNQCNSKMKLVNNRVMYSNILFYSPEMDTTPIRRTMPFSTPVECHFDRYHYSYKVGYVPHIINQRRIKLLRTVEKVMLTPRDEQWRRLLPSEGYIIGHPMFFQADGPHLAEGERLWVDYCFVTVNSSHLSLPRFTVIENHGCMVDSKSSRWSKFIQSDRRNLHMHCEIFIGSSNPTESAKSCIYNQKMNRYSVSMCSDQYLYCGAGNVITSDSWRIASALNMEEEESGPSPALPDPQETDFVEVLTKAKPESQRFLPDTAVEEDGDEKVEPRK
ncbi:hypothetical protein DNTS_013298, partial [Danionella cerebrum]